MGRGLGYSASPPSLLDQVWPWFTMVVHGQPWSTVADQVGCGRPWATVADRVGCGRPWSSMVDRGPTWSTQVDNRRPWSTIVDHCTDPQGSLALRGPNALRHTSAIWASRGKPPASSRRHSSDKQHGCVPNLTVNISRRSVCRGKAPSISQAIRKC